MIDGRNLERKYTETYKYDSVTYMYTYTNMCSKVLRFCREQHIQQVSIYHYLIAFASSVLRSSFFNPIGEIFAYEAFYVMLDFFKTCRFHYW